MSTSALAAEAAAHHLLALSIGPVQSLIEAARRTRDLWAGSQLLSQLANALAQELERAGAELIFPSSASIGATPSGGASNALLAKVSSTKVDAVVNLAQTRLRTALKARSLDTEQRLIRDGYADCVDLPRFRSQWCNAVDLIWASCPLDEAAYAQSYARVQALLGARSNTRLFLPASELRGKVKDAPEPSSLGGRNESVLLKPADEQGRKQADAMRKRYQINQTETLDALGLYKRIGWEPNEVSFPSVVRVALQPWVQDLSDEQRTNLRAVLQKLADVNADAVRGYKVHRDLRAPCGLAQPGPAVRNPYAELSFDGECLLPGQQRQLQAEAPKLDLSPLQQALAGLPKLPEDGPYVCTVAADGDQLGQWLSQASMTQAMHQAMSRSLHAFATDMPGLAAQHQAACLYAGGEDVMALVPVASALSYARALQLHFAMAMQEMVKNGPELGWAQLQRDLPTLSVGLAFTHVLQPTGQARALAREALQLAKNGLDGRGLRNALGVLIEPRSGSRLSLAGPWAVTTDASVNPGHDAGSGAATAALYAQPLDQRLLRWIQAYQAGQLSSGSGYALRELMATCPLNAWASEAKRLFKRRIDPSHHAELSQALPPTASAPQPFEALAADWAAARWLKAHSLLPTAGAPALVQAIAPHEAPNAEQAHPQAQPEAA